MMSSGAMPYFAGQQIHRALRHRQLALARERLRLQLVLIDRAHNQRRAIRFRQRADALELLFAVFQIDRVDDALALAVRQRQFDRARIGGIDHDRRLDDADQLLVEQRNVLDLIAIRALQTDIHDVRAVLHLPARDLDGLFPLLFRDQVLERARPDHVGALAHDQRPVARRPPPPARCPSNRRDAARRASSRGLLPSTILRDGRDVLVGGAAAAAHNIQPAVAAQTVPVAPRATPASPDTGLPRSASPRSGSTKRGWRPSR